MAKKVVYSLLALSAVPAANANAAAVAPAQGTQVQGEMTAADVQEVYQMLEDLDFGKVIDGLQNKLNAGVNEIEQMLADADGFDERVDQDKLEALKQLLKDSKVEIAGIDQDLDDIKNNEENQTEDNYAKVSAPDETNEYVIKLNEILEKARAAFNELNAENENILANDQNQADAQALKDALDELKQAAEGLKDETKKDDINGEVADVEQLVNDFQDAADKANENGTATEFEPTSTKEEIEEAIQAVKDEISTINANFDAYQEVKDAIAASTDAYNKANDLLQKELAGKEEYADMLKDAQKALTKIAQDIKAADEANEGAYAAGESVDKKDEILAMFETNTENILKIAQDAIDKYNAIEAAKEEIKTLQDNLDAVEIKDEFINKDELTEEKEGIQKEIDELSDAVKDAINDPEVNGDYSIADKAGAIQDEIDALNGKVEAAQTAYEKNEQANSDVVQLINDLQEKLDNAKEAVEEVNYEKNDNAPVDERYNTLINDLQTQIDNLNKAAEDAYKAGTSVDFKDNFEATTRELSDAIDEFAEKSIAAYNHYVEVEDKIPDVEDSLKELNDFIAGMTADTEAFKANAEELEGRIEAVKAEIAEAITKEGKEHWEALLAVNAPDAGTTELDKIAQDIEDLLNSATDAQNQYDADQAHDARVAITQEILDRLTVFEDKLAEAESELNDPDAQDALGAAYEELKGQLENIQNELGENNEANASNDENATLYDKFNYNKEYENRDDNLEPDDVKAFSELSKINDALKELTGDIDNLLKDVQDAKNRVADNNKANEELGDLLEDLQDKLDAAIQEVADLDATTSEDPVEKEFADDFNGVQKEIDGLKTEIERLFNDEKLKENQERLEETINNIEDEIDQILEDAKAAQANLDAIAALNDRYEEVKAEYEDAMNTGVAENDQPYVDAVDHFVDQLKDQQTILDLIKEDIDALTNDAVEKKDNLMKRLDNFEQGVNDVLADVTANREAYEKLLNGTDKEDGSVNTYGKYDAQDLWNDKYAEINGNPDSETKTEWLGKLDGLQDEINALAVEINEAYGEGKLSVKENADELQNKINEIINKLNNLSEGYDESIAQENAEMNDAFLTAIAATDEAYERAVKEIDSYRGVNNEDLMAAIEEIVVKYHDEFYMIDELGNVAPNEDTYRQRIQDLKDEAGTAFAEIVSPNKLSSEWVQKAEDLTTEINGKVDALHADIQAVVDAYWADLKAELEGKVAAAEAVIVAYEFDGKKNAFDDVTTLIEEADAFAKDATAENINKLAEKLNELADIDKMLTTDKNEAAKKDIDPRIDEAKGLYEEWKAELTGDALQALNDLYNETVKKAISLENNRYKKETLPGARKTILNYLEKFKNEGQTIVDEYKAAQEAAEELAAAQEELNNKIDEAIEKLEQFLDGDDDIADLEALRDEIEAMDEATDAATIEAEINTIVNDAIDEEQEIIMAKLEELQEEYNRFASENPEEYERAAEMREMIEKARKAGTSETATADDIIEAEQALAELNTALGADNDAAKSELNDQIAALEDEAKLEGVSDEVKEQFKDELDAINDEIADLKDAVANEENADFYKDKLQGEIDAVKAELDAIVEQATAEQAKIDANQAAYDRLMAELDAAQELLDAANANLETLPYGSTFVSATVNYYQNQIDQQRDQVESDYGKTLLTESSENPTFIQNLGTYLSQSVNYAAYREAYKKISDLQAEYNTARGGLTEKDYAASVWNEILEEFNDIQNEINNLILDNYTAYDDQTSLEFVNGLDEKVQELNDRIAALSERVQTIQLGDANHDGKVTLSDYYTLLDIIIGEEKPEPGTPEFVAADINEDGDINIADATALSNLVLYGNVEGTASARAAQNVEENVYVEASQNADGTIRLALNLTNGRAYTGMQMDVVLPEGMSIVAETAGQRAENHGVYTGEFDGFTRVVVASAQNTALAGNNGAVVYIDIEGAGSMDQIEFQNVLFAETNAQLTEFTVGAPVTNGINSIQNDSLMDKVYNMGGRVMNAVKKGINIIKGNDGETKKVVVK